MTRGHPDGRLFAGAAARPTGQPVADGGRGAGGAVAGAAVYPDPLAAYAGALAAGDGVYHAVYRYAAAGADFPYLLWTGPVRPHFGTNKNKQLNKNQQLTCL